MSVVMLVLAMGATVRLSRLVAQDHLTERPRKWLQARLPEALAYLIGCPWCVSFWIGANVAAVAVLWPGNRAVLVVLVALTGSLLAGYLAPLDPPEDFGVHDDEPAGE